MGNPLAIVIDDEEDIRRIARMALRAEGWDVETADDGRAGYRLVREKRPQLIVADFMMPSMSGIELCRKVAEELKMRDIAVLLISGANERAGGLKDFWELPFAKKDFLKKPFDAMELIAKIKAMAPIKGAEKPGPAAAPAPAPAPAPPRGNLIRGASEAPIERGFRILSIDDDEDIREIIQLRLGMEHTVETAVNGMHGLQVMEAFKPDFIITDINMPVMNGLETADAIRKHPIFHDVPIFFLSAETDAGLPRRAFELGANLYLRKPLDPERLVKCVNHFLKEMALLPGKYLAAEKKAAPPAPKPAEARKAPPAKPRMLVADFNNENHRLLKKLLGEGGAAGECGIAAEVFWMDDGRAALGNLNRLEPDGILYNPRNPNLDGVAFCQMLKLNKELDRTKVWLIGTRFYEADGTYSRDVLKHAPISLDTPESALKVLLRDAIVEASRKIRPKQHEYAALLAEERERQHTLQQSDAKKARERDVLRQRLAGVQEFIDRNML